MQNRDQDISVKKDEVESTERSYGCAPSKNYTITDQYVPEKGRNILKALLKSTIQSPLPEDENKNEPTVKLKT